MHPIIENNKALIADLCQKHYIKSLYVFGSASTGNLRDDSDIDFLYTIDLQKFSNWDSGTYDYTDNLIDFESGLTKLLKRAVDLIPDIPIQNRFLKNSIEATKQKIYAA